MPMLLLPAAVTALEARATRRLLLQALKGEAPGEVVLDAANVQHFDSALLAVLLACRRAAEAGGQRVVLRHAPPKLAALAQLYGVEWLVPPPASAAQPAPA